MGRIVWIFECCDIFDWQHSKKHDRNTTAIWFIQLVYSTAFWFIIKLRTLIYIQLLCDIDRETVCGVLVLMIPINNNELVHNCLSIEMSINKNERKKNNR